MTYHSHSPTGMAIDHVLAITRPLHHTTILNKTRCTSLIALFWILAFICGYSDFINVIFNLHLWERKKKIYNLCEFVFLTSYQEEYTVFATVAICLIIMIFSYIRYVQLWMDLA